MPGTCYGCTAFRSGVERSEDCLQAASQATGNAWESSLRPSGLLSSTTPVSKRLRRAACAEALRSTSAPVNGLHSTLTKVPSATEARTLPATLSVARNESRSRRTGIQQVSRKRRQDVTRSSGFPAAAPPVPASDASRSQQEVGDLLLVRSFAVPMRNTSSASNAVARAPVAMFSAFNKQNLIRPVGFTQLCLIWHFPLVNKPVLQFNR